jgi:hypothetical protein
MDYETIAARIAPTGMICRGGFHPGPDDGVPAAAGTAVLVGNAGGEFWRRFRAQFPDGADRPRNETENPLDDWTRRELGAIARELDADVLFPFGGPPHHPFMRWARKAETVFASPIGPLIHPTFGLWHAYRGLLVFAESMNLPDHGQEPSPCDDCAGRPCLDACPVGAMQEDGFDMAPCIAYLAGEPGVDCLGLGCQARRACPVGAEYLYAADQLQFHQRAFFLRHQP